MPPVFAQASHAFTELKDFDWYQLLKPARVGRWPILPRLFMLLLYSLVSSGFVFTASHFSGPRVTDAEYGVAVTLEESINALEYRNVAVATQQLDLARQKIFTAALLQQSPSKVADITQTMDAVRTAAFESGVQLLSVTPEFLADNNMTTMTLKARLGLSSLTTFWLMLSETSIDFRVNAIELERAEKPDLFEMSLGLLVHAAADVGPPTLRSGQPNSAAVSASIVSESAVSKAMPNPKGFLLRSGSSRMVFLVTDENGRLSGVETKIEKQM